MTRHLSLLRGVLFAVLLLMCLPGWIQEDVLGQARIKAGQQEHKRGPIQNLLTTQHVANTFETRQVEGGRIDTEHNIMRAMYRVNTSSSVKIAASPRLSAEAFLTEHANILGLGTDLDDLRVVEDRSTSYSHHITYQQFYNDLPVYQRFLKVNLNKAGEVTMVTNGYAPGLDEQVAFDNVPSVTSVDALQRVDVALEQNIGRNTPGELFVLPSTPARLVWKFIVWTNEPALELELLVDANNGEIVHTRHTSTHAHEIASDSAIEEPELISEPIVQNQSVEALSFGSATGSGLVFDTDPLTTAGRFYGSPFVDDNDNDIPEVNQERILVDLLDISQGSDGLYRLIGPHVQIVGETSSGALNYTPPAESEASGFQYTRSNDFFEAVNVYYHIDKSQRYIQSLNIGRDIQNISIEINPHGLGAEDNSRYFSTKNFIAFGEGGVDDAEDAHVIWHEYGHAILQGSAPNLLSSSEGEALHEGWSDYWAASYARRIAEANGGMRDDWPKLFKWDSGDGAIWAGREVASSGKYPEDVFCDDGGFLCDIYSDGIFWATTLMEIYDEFGAEVTDRLSLASHIYLSHPVSLRDAAEAMLQADLDLYNGAHYNTMVQLFINKGLVTAASLGPVIVHTPLTIVEQLGGEIPVTVEALAVSSPVEQVFVVYTHPGEPADTLFLEAAGGDVYSGILPLPDTPGEVSYYIGATDQFGLSVKLPDQRIVQEYSFFVGPDEEPPIIVHIQQDAIPLVQWPAEITADVEDNLGVDTVYVDYYVDSPFGPRIAEGVFGLERVSSGEFAAFLPVPVELIEPGSTVFYRIIAQDQAQAGNLATLPESGFFGFNIIIEDGLFRYYSFEETLSGFDASGLWEQGSPSFGTRVAFSGDSLWATNPAAAYPDVAQLSSFALPPMNLQGIDMAYLVFWHWFDMEHGGEALPDGDESALLWDGGNVKITRDDGVTWDVLVPQSGYNGRIAAARDNPLEGEAAFGGFSYGWRQVVFEVPAGGTIQLRFDFGTDSGNSDATTSYAGWYIDDVRVLTELSVDTEPPGMRGGVLLPESIVKRAAGQAFPGPRIEISDNVGIESVFVDYTQANGSSTVAQGRLRLEMDSTRLDVFSGEFPIQESAIQVGDIISYRFTIDDFDGNSVSYPENTEDSFRIEYRLVDQLNLVSEVTSTGLWSIEGDTLVLRRRGIHEELSSLVIGPVDLPLNVDNISVNASFTHDIARSSGGNLKISTDGANEWTVIQPLEEYDSVLPDSETVPEAMRNQPVFTGIARASRQVTFDLYPYAGEQVWLRVDFASLAELSTGEFWEIDDLSLNYSTLNPVNNGFDIPRSFALYGNYPDPFSTTTTISYTIDQASLVSLEIYDILGRRIETLVQQEQVAGTYNLQYSASSLSSGVYLMRLVTNQGQLVERIVVSK